MEGGLGQLIFIGLIIFISVIDVVARKRRKQDGAGSSLPPSPHEPEGESPSWELESGPGDEGGASGLEGLVPQEIWEEIGALEIGQAPQEEEPEHVLSRDGPDVSLDQYHAPSPTGVAHHEDSTHPLEDRVAGSRELRPREFLRQLEGEEPQEMDVVPEEPQELDVVPEEPQELDVVAEEPRPPREVARRAVPPAPYSSGAVGAQVLAIRELREGLKGREVRRSFLLHEVLGPPLALRAGSGVPAERD